MDVFDLTIPRFTQGLAALDGWLVRAIAHAAARKFDPDLLVHARLAPDQFAFARQVQATCDAAKWSVARLCGKDGPAQPDTESTIAELRARVASCLAFVGGFRRGDFAGAAEWRCVHAWMGGKWMLGADYVVQYALPNFDFHATTAYAILRHNGVDLGKLDFLSLTLRD